MRVAIVGAGSIGAVIGQARGIRSRGRGLSHAVRTSMRSAAMV
jgi:hypothetical protein